MSIHRVDVVPVRLEKHSNADSLSVVRVSDYTVVVRTQDWIGRDIAAYIEPDYVVPADRSEFSFLAATHKPINNNGITGYRIKVKRLRGVMSMGLLIPAPDGAVIGDNVIDRLGVVRYEQPVPLSTRGEAVAGPPGVHHKYDVESAYRYKHLFVDGEPVIATEKVHGANARYTFVDGVMYCGSRTEWKREDAGNIWWKALNECPALQSFCKANPGITVYGEVYGNVQDLKYGAKNGQVWFVAFDLLRNGEWVDHNEAREIGHVLPWVPVIYHGPFGDGLFELADGKSAVAAEHGVDQIREGIVIKPLQERTNIEIGRTQLKIVSNAYLERA